jgi:hypothetical protein
MKHLLLLITATLTMALFAGAQFAAPFNNAAKSTLATASPGAEDSVISFIHVLPNPAAGRIVVVAGDAKTAVQVQFEAVVYNNSGVPVARKTLMAGTNDIYVSNLGNGLYFLRLIEKDGQTAVKQFAVLR